MPQMIVLKDFKFAHRGIEVEEFTAGPGLVEMTDECAELAMGEGWAERSGEQSSAGADALAGGKAKPDAPENKDATAKPRRNKSNQTE